MVPHDPYMSHEAIRVPYAACQGSLSTRRSRSIARSRRASTTTARRVAHTPSASHHAPIGRTADARRTRRSSREMSLQQWKGHALSVREQCMGKGRVRASASGWRTFRRLVDVLPEGRPVWESNPATSAGSRGGTPVRVTIIGCFECRCKACRWHEAALSERPGSTRRAMSIPCRIPSCASRLVDARRAQDRCRAPCTARAMHLRRWEAAVGAIRRDLGGLPR